MYDILLQQIRDEVTQLGVRELKTAGEVDEVLTQGKGTTLVFVNSVCGCAGGIARPALGLALRNRIKPDHLTSVFASGDRDATARARSYFTNMPHSSPSFAIIRDGKLLHMIHRSDIEAQDPREVAKLLITAFERYCVAAPAPQP